MSMDLIQDLQQKLDELNVSVRHLRKTGTAYAEAERDYKIALRQQALKLRNDGEAIGMISLTIYGVPEIANLRMKRDIAEAVYKANQEAINSIKLQIRIYESQIQREWGINE